MIKPDLAALFVKASSGDKPSLDTVFSVVYPALKKIARGYLYSESRNNTLQPTALVNEAYLKLVSTDDLGWEDRKHFLTLAARSMRQVLVDYARARNADKRGADAEKIPYLTEQMPLPPCDTEQLVKLNDALATLENVAPRQASLVNLRYFAGLSIEETAEVLDISPATAKRDWSVARLWLLYELEEK
ncbi:sigma-70 family RNA polymerase sigma factor [Massilia glaciei]|uniref:sigma-70 family RNA polymerase sigma factor n=1 Tax=Massilia glaciei TaxID=1524097 RepID=UPI0022773261|nr:sigma-70 family RNA polymerase sigma factor [Massilia glaciei]